MKSKLFILTFLCLSYLNAIHENAGTVGFNFLTMNFVAKSQAMGNAGMGLSDDSSALYFSPAAIYHSKNHQFSLSYYNYLLDFSGGSINYIRPAGKISNMGFFLQNLNSGDIKETDSAGQEIGEFSTNNFLVGFSYARVMNDIIIVGGNVKFIYEKLYEDNSASAIAFDINLLHQTVNPRVQLGIGIKNLGKQITYFSEKKYNENLPTQIVAGLNYKFDNDKGNICFDVIKPSSNEIKAHLGAEMKVHKMLKLRAGYKSNSSEWKTDGDFSIFSGISTGFGLEWRRYILDYAVYSMGELGFVNQLTINYKL